MAQKRTYDLATGAELSGWTPGLGYDLGQFFGSGDQPDSKLSRTKAMQLEQEAAGLAQMNPERARQLRIQAKKLRGERNPTEAVQIELAGEKILGPMQKGYNYLFGDDEAKTKGAPAMSPEQMAMALQDPNMGPGGGAINAELIKRLYAGTPASTVSLPGRAPEFLNYRAPPARQMGYANMAPAQAMMQGARPQAPGQIPMADFAIADALMAAASPRDYTPVGAWTDVMQGLAAGYNPHLPMGSMLMSLGLGAMAGLGQGRQREQYDRRANEDRYRDYQVQMAGFETNKASANQDTTRANIEMQNRSELARQQWQLQMADLEARIAQGRSMVDEANADRMDRRALLDYEMMKARDAYLSPKIDSGMVVTPKPTGGMDIYQPAKPAKQPDIGDLIKLEQYGARNTAMPPTDQMLSDPLVSEYLFKEMGFEQGVQDPAEFLAQLGMMQSGGKDAIMMLSGQMLNKLTMAAAQGDVKAQLALQRLRNMQQRNVIAGAK